jgi:2,3-bisphosphoglycerate-independent phosphoglycerate mutase
MQTIQNLSPRCLLVILDGFGINQNSFKNAISAASKPHLENLFQNYPYTTIQPGGEAVGLPKGVAGNSEVGHLNLGAGRPVRQDLVRINELIQQGTFGNQEKLKELITFARSHTKRIHLMGLLSDGGVHSHINHLKEIIKNLRTQTDLQVYLHAFTDGRDTSKDKGIEFVKDILKEPGFIFASMGGRSIGMDRDRRWSKIEHAYKTMIGDGDKTKLKPQEYILEEYKKGIFDEFITPVLFSESGKIEEGDCVFFYNYRPDRAKQISLAMNDPQFKEFNIPIRPGYFLCMSPYIQEELPELPVFLDKEKVPGTFSEYLSRLGRGQFKIAETEKYAHVTYFFNGGEEKPFPGEERCMIPSPRDISTYDQKPQMSANEVTEKLLEALDDKKYSFYLVNFANPDMVGHTGNFESAIKAVESVDACIGRIWQKCHDLNIAMVITADHGNADQMAYEDGSPHTSHSEAEVPFCVIHPRLKGENILINHESKILALKDVAPTILKILNLPKPKEFSGSSIFV